MFGVGLSFNFYMVLILNNLFKVILPIVYKGNMEYKTLAGYEEIEVNEMGEVRWSNFRSKRKQPTIWYGAKFNT